MPKPPDRLSAQLVAASLEFHRLRLWTELEQDSAFLIRLPDEPDPIVASVLGQGGEHFGLSLHRGAGGIESMRRILLGEYDETPPVVENTVMISVSFERLEVIPVERRTILADAGFSARREAIAPNYFVWMPSRLARMPNRTEMRLLLAALRTVIAARADGPLESGWVDSDADLFTLRRIEDEGAPPRIVREREPLPPMNERAADEPPKTEAVAPTLQNTDGDPLVLQRATFSFSDREAVVATLRAHKEIECEDEAASKPDSLSFTWLRTTAKGKKALGGPTVYGSITVNRDALVADVNSERRLKLLRKMLESIRGVRFVGTEVKPLDMKTLRSKERPSPPPLPNDPAMADALRKFLHERQMAWLDTKVPALGNKTPRQVAKTKEGREKVAMMIRTMPAASGPGGISIEPPRAEMLRAIGLNDTGAPAE